MSRKILILTNRVPYPLHDGGALAMDTMIRGYKQSGWEVHLLAMNTSRHHVGKEVLDSLYQDLDGFETVDVDNRLKAAAVLKNFLFSRQPEHVQRFQSEAFPARLSALLAQVNPDVVQLESPFLASYIPLIRQHAGIRIVYRSHNIEGEIWKRLADESGGMKRLYLRSLSQRIARYEQQLWSNVDLILPISESDAAAIRQPGVQTPICVAPYGIRTPSQDVSVPPGPLKAYHIGAMDWLPNQEAVTWFLTEVWPLLYQRAPRLSFHFAGRNMPPAIQQGLPEGVFCAGEVADAEAFIADKHLLVVPLRSGSGIRVKTLEAMAAGKLVVSTDIGMQGIQAQPDVHYLRANSAEEFSKMIAWTAEHPEKVSAIVGAARRLMRDQYDGQTIMQRVVSAIDEIAPVARP